MGMIIRLLLFYWFDEEGKSKENKIKKMCRSPQILEALIILRTN
jgi:hypothetical protein